MTAILVKNIDIPLSQIRDFCLKWQIVEFGLFGSVLRDDFRPDSDIDCLVKFGENSPWSLLDMVQMQQELEQIFSRKVDLLTQPAIENSQNWLRKKEILSTAKVIYATEK